MGCSLKNKKGITITNAFQKISDESQHKTNKIWVDKGNFMKDKRNHGYKIIIKKSIQHIIQKNLLLQKNLLEP